MELGWKLAWLASCSRSTRQPDQGQTGTTHDAAIDEPAVDCAKPAAAAQFPGHYGRPLLQGPGVQYGREDVKSGMGGVERVPGQEDWIVGTWQGTVVR